MNELATKDIYGVFIDKDNTARVSSLQVAQIFNKRHDNVLDAIRKITSLKSDASSDFAALNFKESHYKDFNGKYQPCYNMTRDGFTLLAMSFTGKRAMRFKLAYIQRFNEMEKQIIVLTDVKSDFPLLTDAIKMAHDEPKGYHFSNEANMLNKIVTGYSTKEYRTLHNISQKQSIRPYLTLYQIELLDTLQKVDIGLLVSVPDYHIRKKILENYKLQRESKTLLA